MFIARALADAAKLASYTVFSRRNYKKTVKTFSPNPFSVLTVATSTASLPGKTQTGTVMVTIFTRTP